MDKSTNYKMTNHRKVIIDTDGGIDDMRSIVLILSSAEIAVLAINVSNGILTAADTYKKVVALCHHLGREDIPVGICRNNSFKPDKYTMAQKYSWGPEIVGDIETAPGSIDIIQSVIDAGHDDITFVCLGGLTMVMSALCQISEFKNVLCEVVWSAVSIDDTNGFNYLIDPPAAMFILRQDFPISLVKRYRIGDSRFFDQCFIDRLGTLKTIYAQTIWECLTNEYVQDHEFIFTAADEMVALYLNAPSCFTVRSKGCINEYTPADADGLRIHCIEILACLQPIPVLA
jgi:inosine-uridine nucleoside N-ribohydrolase